MRRFAAQLRWSILLPAFIVSAAGAPWILATAYRHVPHPWPEAIASLCMLVLAALIVIQGNRLRKSKAAARNAQAVLRAVAKGSLDAFYILNSHRGPDHRIADFVYIDLNDRGAQLIGKLRTEILGAKLCELLPVLRTDGLFDKYVKAVESGESLEEEFQIDAPNIQARWLHHQIIPMDDGIVITTRDISARKHAEMETRSNRAFLQSLIDHLPLLIYAKNLRADNSGRIIVWNKAAEAVTGYPEQDVIGKTNREAFPPNMAEMYDEVDRKILADPMVVDYPEVPFRRSDGGLRFMHIISVPLLGDDNRPEYVLGIAEDITGRRGQELALRTKQAELAAANDASPLGLFRTNPQGGCTYVNRTYEEMSGMARDQALGNGWVQAIHPEDRVKVFQGWGQSSRTHTPYQGTYRFRHPDGRIVWVSVKTAPIIVDGRIEGYAGSVDDITARREAEQALSDSEQRLRTIADTLPALVAYIDADERYRFNNIAYERVFGVSRNDIRDKTVREFAGEEEYRFIKPYIEQVLQGAAVTFEQEAQQDSIYRCNEATYIPQFADGSRQVVGFHVMVQDITAKKREERRLLQLTQIDSLTGLVNRAGFEQKLADAMAHSQTSGALIAVMYLDIDHFKSINDTHGHHAGDLLLKAFGSRLSLMLRSADTIARLGGDEFTIIMQELGRMDDAEAIAAKIVHAIQSPFFLEEISVSITVSLGLAFYQSGTGDPKALIRQADEMLYLAKEAGRNAYRAAPFTALKIL